MSEETEGMVPTSLEDAVRAIQELEVRPDTLILIHVRPGLSRPEYTHLWRQLAPALQRLQPRAVICQEQDLRIEQIDDAVLAGQGYVKHTRAHDDPLRKMLLVLDAFSRQFSPGYYGAELAPLVELVLSGRELPEAAREQLDKMVRRLEG